MVFFFKQKTAYEMRISDWSSDVCSSDLAVEGLDRLAARRAQHRVAAVAGGGGTAVEGGLGEDDGQGAAGVAKGAVDVLALLRRQPHQAERRPRAFTEGAHGVRSVAAQGDVGHDVTARAGLAAGNWESSVKGQKGD